MPTGAGTLRRQVSSSTRGFLYSRWVARRTAAMTMIVLYACILWVMFGKSSDGYLLEALILAACGGIAAIYMIISRHPVTRLHIGPDGISAPFGTIRHVKWRDIDKAVYVPKHHILWYPQEWLVFQLKPGTTGILRIPMPRKIEQWILDRLGVRFPLHALGNPSQDVLESVECFMPVLQADGSQEDKSALP